VFDWERQHAQQLSVEIGMALDLDAAAAGDLSASIDYSAVLDELQFIAVEGRWRLLESLISAMMRHLLAPPGEGEARAQLDAVRIKLTKPYALERRAVPSVEMQRERSWFTRQRLRRTADDGVEIDVVAEAKEAGAYHLLLPRSASFQLPNGAALLVIAGVGQFEGRTLAVGDKAMAPGSLRAESATLSRALVVTRPPLGAPEQSRR
jgi:FolB domain-containing protein